MKLLFLVKDKLEALLADGIIPKVVKMISTTPVYSPLYCPNELPAVPFFTVIPCVHADCWCASFSFPSVDKAAWGRCSLR